jgi:hypothetical protein
LTFKYNDWGVCERPMFEACRSNLQAHKVKTHIADAPCLSFWFILGEISHDLSVWPRISMPSALMFQCHSLHPPCCQVRAQQLPFSREWNCCLGVPLLLSHTGVVKSLITSTFRAQIPKISGNFTLGYWFVKLFGDDNGSFQTKEYERNIATDPATYLADRFIFGRSREHIIFVAWRWLKWLLLLPFSFSSIYNLWLGATKILP